MPAPRIRASSASCSAGHTPAFRHSSRRFQSVMPQQPISWGKSSQAMPVLSTKRMPVRHTRSPTRGCPPARLGSCFGNSGSTTAHRSSVTNSFDMASSLTASTDMLDLNV